MGKAHNIMKIVAITISILLLGFALSIVKTAVSIWAYPTHATKVYKCPSDILLVMGAAQYDGVPSPIFKRRLDKALELYQQGCGNKILVTGGKQDGDRFSEGESGVNYLKVSGVPEENLYPEIYSCSSRENLSFSKSHLINKKVFIVTDDMHAYRTQWLANKLDLNAIVVPVKTKYQKWRYALRELAIMTVYSLTQMKK